MVASIVAPYTVCELRSGHISDNMWKQLAGAQPLKFFRETLLQWIRQVVETQRCCTRTRLLSYFHTVFSTVGAYFLKNNLLLLLCLQWQGQKHPNSTGATLRWSFLSWMRRCTWRQRAALWSRLGRELVRRCRNTGRSVKTDVWQWGTLRTGAGSPGLCHWLRVFNLKSVETHETHEPRVCVDYRSLN